MKKKMITKVIFRYHQPFMTGGILTAQPEKSFFLYAFFNQIQYLIQSHGNYTQNYDREKYPCEFKGLGTINNKITEPLACTDEFTDDHTDQTQTDIDLHNTENEGDRRRKDDFGQFIFFGSTKSANQFLLFGINLSEPGIKINDGTKDGNRYS